MNFNRFTLSPKNFYYLIMCFILTGSIAVAQDSITISEWGESHEQPIAMVPWMDGNFLLIEKSGNVETLDADGNHLNSVLDVSDHIGSADGEQGLLGLAVHPAYPDSPYIY